MNFSDSGCGLDDLEVHDATIGYDIQTKTRIHVQIPTWNLGTLWTVFVAGLWVFSYVWLHRCNNDNKNSNNNTKMNTWNIWIIQIYLMDEKHELRCGASIVRGCDHFNVESASTCCPIGDKMLTTYTRFQIWLPYVTYVTVKQMAFCEIGKQISYDFMRNRGILCSACRFCVQWVVWEVLRVGPDLRGDAGRCGVDTVSSLNTVHDWTP